MCVSICDCTLPVIPISAFTSAGCNDAGGSPSTSDLWSANKIDTEINSAVAALGATKIDTVPAAVVGNLPVFIAGGQLTDSGDSIASLTASLSGLFVDLVSAQTIAGNKTFSDNIIVTGNLNVSGTTATINTSNLTVADKNIHINFGYSGATSGSDGAGITVDRNAGSPPGDPAASIVWDDATTRWKAGLEGSEFPIALDGISLFQPFYEAQVAGVGSPPVGSPPAGNAVYNLGFAVKTPVAGTAALQVFVNGIKQMEGAGKAFTANYTGNVIVTFEAGSEPTTGADVEFYGFGYIA